MTVPSAAQVALLRQGVVQIMGSHTLGGPDGGPGLPMTGWSLLHGDLRVPHFVGLHALQVLPLAIWLGRRLGIRSLAFARLASVSYFALFALLLWQALRGQSVAAPDAPMLASLTGWFVITAAAAIVRRPAPQLELR